MSKKRPYLYEPLKNHSGISKHLTSNRYQATKKINGKTFRKTFSSIREAQRWRNVFDGTKKSLNPKTATLKEVWEVKQKRHFPTLAKSTIEIWHRRYELLKSLEHLHMENITSSVITKWVETNVNFFKSEDYEGNNRGRSKRCNLDNELNLFKTIFNWYKDCEEFEYEARNLVNPIKTKHKKLGFIRAKPIKDKAISLEHALKFFGYLKPLYRDLAMLQFFTASRIGEVAGLQWKRVDFENSKLTIMETCSWDMKTKTYIGLNPHPKNKEPRPVYMTPEIREILQRRFEQKEEGSNFVFHVEGQPLNYGTIQLNYREAQRKGNLPYSGTHILRHGMAKLARKVGGGLDAVIAMTGHKDYRLAAHYSKLDFEFQKEVSEQIMEKVRSKTEPQTQHDNVLNLSDFKRSQSL